MIVRDWRIDKDRKWRESYKGLLGFCYKDVYNLIVEKFYIFIIYGMELKSGGVLVVLSGFCIGVVRFDLCVGVF